MTHAADNEMENGMLRDMLWHRHEQAPLTLLDLAAGLLLRLVIGLAAAVASGLRSR